MTSFRSQVLISGFFAFVCNSNAQEKPDSFRPARCELIPLPEHQISFQIDGVEKTRWHFGEEYPRPFFFPLNVA